MGESAKQMIDPIQIRDKLHTPWQNEEVIVMQGLCKAYPGVQALDCIDLNFKRGEIHALLGQNGAGKSTLVRMLSGAEQPDAGTMEVNGVVRSFKTPQEAQKAGIFTIFQELSLVPELSVAENIFISDLPKNRFHMVDWKSLKYEAAKSMEWLGFSIDVDCPVSKLSVAQKQGIELAKALHHKAGIVLLDEPSAALPQPDVKRLFEVLNTLKRNGLGIVYISHRLEEVQELCDVATVLRDGKKVGTYKVSETPSNALVRAMVGRNVKSSLIGEVLTGEGKPRLGTGRTGEVVMSINGFDDGQSLHDVSFELRKGEVLGITGLLGNGQSELAACMFGRRPLKKGWLSVAGKPILLKGPRSVISCGIGLLPEERKTQGLVLPMSIESNITLASHRDFSHGSVIDRKLEQRAVENMISVLRISATSSKQPVGTLSGGNQQKVVLAKWLVSKCQILIFSEPTRGIDVGAKEEIYQLIKQFTADGGSVVIISSEIPEASMCDRVMVMSDGSFSGSLDFDQIDTHNDALLHLCCK